MSLLSVVRHLTALRQMCSILGFTGVLSASKPSVLMKAGWASVNTMELFFIEFMINKRYALFLGSLINNQMNH